MCQMQVGKASSVLTFRGYALKYTLTAVLILVCTEFSFPTKILSSVKYKAVHKFPGSLQSYMRDGVGRG